MPARLVRLDRERQPRRQPAVSSASWSASCSSDSDTPPVSAARGPGAPGTVTGWQRTSHGCAASAALSRSASRTRRGASRARGPRDQQEGAEAEAPLLLHVARDRALRRPARRELLDRLDRPEPRAAAEGLVHAVRRPGARPATSPRSRRGPTPSRATSRSRSPIRSRSAGQKPKTYPRFETGVPTFANTDDLSSLLAEKKVVLNAKAARPAAEHAAHAAPLVRPDAADRSDLRLRSRAGRGGAGGAVSRPRPLEGRAVRGDHRSARRSTTSPASTRPRQELVEIVDFLKNPTRYTRLGGAIPKGVLLAGQPGTGKTLLARAVAGEANVPFYSLSASEFVEIIVGVGASRVRDLFDQAKKTRAVDHLHRRARRDRPPARRFGASLGGHDEREQTLNQILTEMDGFTGSEGVIVLAATNRPEVLDAALLRPGRFDRRVFVNPPDAAGREAILRVHTRNVPLAPDVDLRRRSPPARPGMVGADLKNLVNEAALTAARRNHEQVELADFTDSLERIILGAERQHPDLAGRARAHRLPRVAATRCSACCAPAPTRCARSRSCPAAARSASPSSRPTPTATATTSPTCGAASSARWRPGRGAGRLRRLHDRRRVRPRAGHADRADDGRPLGHVGEGRHGLGAAGAAGRADCCSPARARAGRRRRRVS